MQKILVTGDKGYIGSVLVPLLSQEDFKVVGIDSEYFADSISSANVKSSYKHKRLDIRKVEREDVEGVDAVIHLSALSNDPLGEIDAQLTHEINFVATIRLAEIAKSVGVKRFLFSSSCSVYGIAGNDVIDEASKVNPLTAYAESKVRSERELRKMASNNFCVGLLRNATVYGYSPNFRNDLVANNLVTCAIALKKIKVLSDGTPWRPLIDVRDLARAFIEFLKVKKELINGEVVNVGFKENNFQIRGIVAIIQEFLPGCEIEYTGEHGSDVRSYRVNFDKFQTIFPNFRQEWPLKKSIRDMIQNLQRINYSKEDFLSGRHTRLATLRKLLGEKRVNKDLYFL